MRLAFPNNIDKNNYFFKCLMLTKMLNIKFKLNRVENMVDESIYRLNDKINVIESDEND